MRFKDKHAGERVLSFYWILIFILITVGIVSATIVFYKAPLDVRTVEARVFGDRIIDCFTEGGLLSKNNLASISNDGSNLENICGLTFEDAVYDENQFYVEIIIEGSQDNKDRKIVFDKDDSGKFKELCEQGSGNYPVCYEEKLFVIDKEGDFGAEGDFVLISVLTSVNKLEQYVK